MVAIYVDDCYTIVPEGTARSELDTLKGSDNILGLALSPDKQVGPKVAALLPGGNISLGQRLIRVELPKMNARAIIQDLEIIAGYNILSSSGAAEIRGRIGFIRSLLFARFGKDITQPIKRRRYAHFRKKPQLSAERRYCLKWRVSTRRNPTPRVAPLKPLPTIDVYSDAARKGQLGAFLAINGPY